MLSNRKERRAERDELDLTHTGNLFVQFSTPIIRSSIETNTSGEKKNKKYRTQYDAIRYKYITSQRFSS